MSVDIEEQTRIVPHRFIEYGYYFSMFYAIMGSALGLSISFLGAGLVTVLAVLCIFTLGSRTKIILSSISFPLGCAVTFVFVQCLWHGESLMGPYVRPFIIWVFSLVIIQSLALRKGFLHRFTMVMFLIGLALLPFLSLSGSAEAEVHRFGLRKEVGLSNPNAFGAWFGFCSVYFFIRGFLSRSSAYRAIFWSVAIACLFLVTLTVSRGALLATVAAMVVASRYFITKSFAPILVLALFGMSLVGLGIFDDAIRSYGMRGAEDTGRLKLWPVIIQRFIASPLIGVGITNVGTFLSATKAAVTPHNGFLFIALTSGIVPLLLFLVYWARAFRKFLHQKFSKKTDAPFLTSMLTFSFLETLLSNTTFMAPWAMMTVAVVMEAGRIKPRRVSERG